MAQFILGLLFMVLGTVVPFWLPLVLYVAMVGAAVIGLITADAVRDEVDRQDIKLEKNVFRMREFPSKGQVLVSLNRVSEAIRPLEKLA